MALSPKVEEDDALELEDGVAGLGYLLEDCVPPRRTLRCLKPH